jgi:hypothetical protein
MKKKYQIIFEYCDEDYNDEILSPVVMEGVIAKPQDLFGLGFSHQEQIGLIQSLQDKLLKEQSELMASEDCCPHCQDNQMVKNGKQVSDYHDVLTDHKLSVNRCKKCKYEPSSTVLKLIGSTLSGDLTRIQTELGSNYSCRDYQELFSKFFSGERSVNNHDRIK